MEIYNKCCLLRSQLEDLAPSLLDSGNSKLFSKIADISHTSSKILSNFESINQNYNNAITLPPSVGYNSTVNRGSSVTIDDRVTYMDNFDEFNNEQVTDDFNPFGSSSVDTPNTVDTLNRVGNTVDTLNRVSNTVDTFNRVGNSLNGSVRNSLEDASDFENWANFDNFTPTNHVNDVHKDNYPNLKYKDSKSLSKSESLSSQFTKLKSKTLKLDSIPVKLDSIPRKIDSIAQKIDSVPDEPRETVKQIVTQKREKLEKVEKTPKSERIKPEKSSKPEKSPKSVKSVESEKSDKSVLSDKKLIELEIEREQLKLQQLKLKCQLQSNREHKPLELTAGHSHCSPSHTTQSDSTELVHPHSGLMVGYKQNVMDLLTELMIGNDIEPLWRVENDGGLSNYLGDYARNGKNIIKTNKFSLEFNTNQLNMETFTLNLRIILQIYINISSIQLVYHTGTGDNSIGNNTHRDNSPRDNSVRDNTPGNDTVVGNSVVILSEDNCVNKSVERNMNIELMDLCEFPRLMLKCVENDGNINSLELKLPIGIFQCVLPLEYTIQKFNNLWNLINNNKIRIFLSKLYVNVNEIINILQVYFSIKFVNGVILLSGYGNEIILGNVIIKNNSLIVVQLKSKSELLINSVMEILKEMFSTLNNKYDCNIYQYVLKRVKQLPLKYQSNIKYTNAIKHY